MAENQSSDDTDTEENSQEDGARIRKKPRYSTCISLCKNASSITAYFIFFVCLLIHGRHVSNHKQHWHLLIHLKELSKSTIDVFTTFHIMLLRQNLVKCPAFSIIVQCIFVKFRQSHA